MKLSELNATARKLNLHNDVNIIIELEEDNCMNYTGVLTASKTVSWYGIPLLSLLPASCLKSVPLKDTAIQTGVTSAEKKMLWKNIK